MKWEICELPILLPSHLWGISFACLLHGVKKPPKHHGSTRSRYQDLVYIPRPLCIVFFRMVRPSVCVKKLFEALTGNFLPFLVSYSPHFICSYNMNYNLRPLRGPSIILIELHCLFSVGFGSFIKNISKIRQSNLFWHFLKDLKTLCDVFWLHVVAALWCGFRLPILCALQFVGVGVGTCSLHRTGHTEMNTPVIVDSRGGLSSLTLISSLIFLLV